MLGYQKHRLYSASSETRKHCCVSLSVITVTAVSSQFPPPQVHSMYRRTGASFQKAQQEFSQGVFTSKTFQTAAAGAASSAAQGAFRENN